MRRTGRQRLSLAVLLLAVFLQAAIGVLVTCHLGAVATDPVARVAVVDALPAGTTCPGCAAPEPGPSTDPASTDHPCPGPVSDHRAGDTVTRASTSTLPSAPVVAVAAVAVAVSGPPAAPVSPAGPVPTAAVREPVAVLCVDRN